MTYFFTNLTHQEALGQVDMTEILQIGSLQIAATEIIPLLAGYQMLPQLLREIIIDQAIAPFACTEVEKSTAMQQYIEKNQISSEAQLQAWLEFHGMTTEQFESLSLRGLRIEKFKLATWGNKLESYFLSRKGQLDKVIYSLLRTNDVGIAQELYFRILEGEQSFAELATEYSQGPETQTGGIIGPVEMSTPHPTLAQLLRVSQPGKLSPPMHLGEWLVIIRLEKLIGAQLDEAMRIRLLNELFNTWLQEQITQLSSVRSASPQLAA